MGSLAEDVPAAVVTVDLESVQELRQLLAIVTTRKPKTAEKLSTLIAQIEPSLLVAVRAALEIGRPVPSVRSIGVARLVFLSGGFSVDDANNLTFVCPDVKEYENAFAMMHTAVTELIVKLTPPPSTAAAKRPRDDAAGDDEEQDTADEYLSKEKRLETAFGKLPADFMSAAQLKEILSMVTAVKDAKAGVHPSSPPGPLASGARPPAARTDLFDEYFGATGLIGDGSLLQRRVLQVADNGALVASASKKPEMADFFAKLGGIVRSVIGTPDEEALKIYEEILRLLSDLGFPFERVLRLDTKTREGWRQAGRVTVDRSAIMLDFVVRTVADMAKSDPTLLEGGSQGPSSSKSPGSGGRGPAGVPCKVFNSAKKCTWTPCKFSHVCAACGSSKHGEASPLCPDKRP